MEILSIPKNPSLKIEKDKTHLFKKNDPMRIIS